MTLRHAILERAIRTLRGYVRYAPGQRGKAALVRHLLDSYLERYPISALARTTFGSRVPVDTSDLIQRYLYLFGIWEPNLTAWIKHRLRPGDTFVDVGANVGYFSLLASKLVGPTGRVIAIEAWPSMYQHLTRTLAVNDCRNTRTVNLAVSDASHAGLRFYLEDPYNLGATTLVPPSGNAHAAFTADADRLPDILTETELATARVIKIDVEGAEGAVVRGLMPHLDRLRPDAELVIEVHPRRMAAMGDDADELLSGLTSNRFHAYQMANDYTAASYPAALRAPTPPLRLDNRITDMADLVFSQVDARALE